MRSAGAVAGATEAVQAANVRLASVATGLNIDVPFSISFTAILPSDGVGQGRRHVIRTNAPRGARHDRSICGRAALSSTEVFASLRRDRASIGDELPPSLNAPMTVLQNRRWTGDVRFRPSAQSKKAPTGGTFMPSAIFDRGLLFFFERNDTRRRLSLFLDCPERHRHPIAMKPVLA